MLGFFAEVIPGGDCHQDVCVLSQIPPLQVRHEPRYYKNVGLTWVRHSIPITMERASIDRAQMLPL